MRLRRALGRATARSAVAHALCCVLAGAPAGAADLSVSGFFNQRFDVDSNPGSSTSHVDDPEASTSTSLGIVVTSRTPRTSFSFAPGVSFTATSSDETLETDQVAPRFNGRITRLGRRAQVSAGLSVIPSLTSRDSDLADFFVTPPDFGAPPIDPETPIDPEAPVDPEPPDLGGPDDPSFREGANGTALRLTTSADLRGSLSLDPRNSINAGIDAQFERYLGDAADFSETDSYGFSTGFSHRLDPRTSLSLNGGAQLFTADTAERTFNIGVGFSRSATPRLSYTTNLGVLLADSDAADSEPSISFNGGAGFSWRGPDYSLSGGVRQGASQDEFGTLQNRASLSLNASHQIDRRLGVSLPTQLSLSNPVFGEGGDEITFTTGPSVSYALTPDWAMSLGYRFRATLEGEDGDPTASLVFFQLSYNFAFLR